MQKKKLNKYLSKSFDKEIQVISFLPKKISIVYK